MSSILSLPVYGVVAAGILALIYAAARSSWINKQDAGTDEMKTIAGHIREGAMAFLGREYRVLAIFVAVVAVLLAISNASMADSHWLIALSFVVGAGCSGLAGFFGMRVATAANVRTTAAARTGLNKALGVAFAGGSVMGMSVVGLGVLGLTLLLILFASSGIFLTEGFHVAEYDRLLNVLAGFSLGASSIALFARVGGGIYTKAADVGADLVGKVEAGIPEDDPRNPATIADNVGDNVGDVAGMGADLFESYVGSILGAMIIGVVVAGNLAGVDGTMGFVLLPLFLAAIGIVASIFGSFFVRTNEGGNPQKALHMGTVVAAIVTLVATWFMIGMVLPEGLFFTADLPITQRWGTHGLGLSAHVGVFVAALVGLAAGLAIGLLTEYYTSDHYGPVKHIAKSSLTGPATNIIAGLAVGMMSTAIPVILVVIAILASYYCAGLYGVALAALGMLSTTGIQLAVDAYGPIADNAGGIAEMSELPKEVRARTDKLDAVGNTTAAIGKGFAIGSAALTALALFSAFTAKSGLRDGQLDVTHPEVMAGLFLGGILPYVFSAMAMNAVGRAASSMIDEVRRQFREIKGLLQGTAKADYARCVDISTAAAIKEMVLPGILAVVTPVIIGLWSMYALGGLLAGVTVSGVLLAIFQSNAGGAWDNAKKHIEGGAFGGKGSDAHKAAVTGDTVGDPFKDTAGPSLNILIKLITVVALVTAPVLVSFHSKAQPEQTSASVVEDGVDVTDSSTINRAGSAGSVGVAADSVRGVANTNRVTTRAALTSRQAVDAVTVPQDPAGRARLVAQRQGVQARDRHVNRGVEHVDPRRQREQLVANRDRLRAERSQNLRDGRSSAEVRLNPAAIRRPVAALPQAESPSAVQ
ncbi:MAG: sodium-translocating pyrophosphatase [Myxococcales bacterium]|nr:sodium-translocating pyrophosphatase [Myxococcales bacterium]